MPGPLTRRTLVRSTAHAAWAVPAITVASAAPAFACSPGTDVKELHFVAGEPPLTLDGVQVLDENEDLHWEYWITGITLHNKSECDTVEPGALIITVQAWNPEDGEKVLLDFFDATTSPAPSSHWYKPTILDEKTAQWVAKTPIPPGGIVTFGDTLIGLCGDLVNGNVTITATAAGWKSGDIDVIDAPSRISRK